MKVSVNWLRDYVEIDLSAERIAEILMNLGLPCEGIEQTADDAVIDVEVTSNRGDCLSHIGIARELAAATGKTLRLPDVHLEEMDRPASDFVSVEIREPAACARYTARVIEGVKIGPSPDWVVKRLEAVGMRSVNNVVDATNYAMMETGQPPHAFDCATIEGARIIVRKATPGEQLVSIDGTKCELTPEMLVIADANRPVALAGVMGGLQTEVKDGTTTILLEDAWFDPVTIRTTSRRLSLPSEASFRFERIVDVERIDWASRRTAQLIVQWAGGRVAKGVVDAYPRQPKPRQVRMRLSRLSKLLGIEVPQEAAMKILAALQFEPRWEDGSILCTSPTWRSDISREVDLIEEVARVYGYDKVGTRTRIQIEARPADARQKLSEAIGTFLNGCGYYETVNVTFVDRGVADLFVAPGAGHLAVRDVTRKTGNLLRQTLLTSLLEVLKTNVNARNLPCCIYEMADTFVPSGALGSLPTERTKVALVTDGSLRQLRGAVEGLVGSINRTADVRFEPMELVWAEVGARIMVNGREIGQAGVFADAIRQKFDLKDLAPCGAELDFEELAALKSGPIKIRPIPRFPAIDRDLSILVPEQTAWVQIAQAVESVAPAELEETRFVDIYRGKGIAPGVKSVTLSLRFRDDDGTLTHDAVDRHQAAILESLAKAVGAELRTV
ncbi:MAG TPA: phenylalanine--tRNA ligase subunit beta [Sedimentisphaerales bacterium]|jgi:phenylalanyl-tRNA synthetase beta chain|nr:phenylalanine--tRNA ligase subunit beta [Sedimentisphaerales bacterium]HNU28471.1 phenylalanine--tRNA ligase subunit beta [Sedimentisphaerales bacterium]